MNCVIHGCTRTVDPQWCLCGEHWRVIPEHLRAPLSRAYNPHAELGAQASGFHAALARVHGWVRETFGGQDDRPRRSWETLVAWVRGRDAERAVRRGVLAPVIAEQRSSSTPDDAPPLPVQLSLL